MDLALKQNDIINHMLFPVGFNFTIAFVNIKYLDHALFI